MLSTVTKKLVDEFGKQVQCTDFRYQLEIFEAARVFHAGCALVRDRAYPHFALLMSKGQQGS